MVMWIRQTLKQLCLALGVSLCLWPALSFSDEFELVAEQAEPGFQVLMTDIVEQNDVLRLSAGFDLVLSQELIDAVHSGVPIRLNIEMEVLRERAYWLDSNVATVIQSYLLEYNALTRRYVLENSNTTAHYNLPSLAAALGVMSGLTDFPFLDVSLLNPDFSYYARMRVLIDVDTLPVPLRVMAYISSRWHLTSDWYQWPLP